MRHDKEESPFHVSGNGSRATAHSGGPEPSRSGQLGLALETCKTARSLAAALWVRCWLGSTPARNVSRDACRRRLHSRAVRRVAGAAAGRAQEQASMQPKPYEPSPSASSRYPGSCIARFLRAADDAGLPPLLERGLARTRAALSLAVVWSALSLRRVRGRGRRVPQLHRFSRPPLRERASHRLRPCTILQRSHGSRHAIGYIPGRTGKKYFAHLGLAGSSKAALLW
jgi:hypothetical protein